VKNPSTAKDIIDYNNPLFKTAGLEVYFNELKYKNKIYGFDKIEHIGWYFKSDGDVINTKNAKLILYFKNEKIIINKTTIYITPELVHAYNYIAKNTFKNRLNFYRKQLKQRGDFIYTTSGFFKEQYIKFFSDGKIKYKNKIFELSKSKIKDFEFIFEQNIFSLKASIQLEIDKDILMTLLDQILKNPKNPTDYVIEEKQVQSLLNMLSNNKSSKNTKEERISSKKLHNIEKQSTTKATSIRQESNKQSRDLKEIELPTFEKIRRYYSNLEDADELHVEFAKDGKKHKALMYSALDKLFEHMDDKKLINIIEYNCGQAMDTSLLLDYIREKQLDVEVPNIILIDYNTKTLDRASLHVDILKNSDIYVKIIQKQLHLLNESDLGFNNQNSTIHLFSNIFYYDLSNINKRLLDTIPLDDSYFMCISPNKNDARVDEIYNYFGSTLISSRDKKIGRFERYEKIFAINSLIYR
jgi:hypothetical protein